MCIKSIDDLLCWVIVRERERERTHKKCQQFFQHGIYCIVYAHSSSMVCCDGVGGEKKKNYDSFIVKHAELMGWTFLRAERQKKKLRKINFFFLFTAIINFQWNFNYENWACMSWYNLFKCAADHVWFISNESVGGMDGEKEREKCPSGIVKEVTNLHSQIGHSWTLM